MSCMLVYNVQLQSPIARGVCSRNYIVYTSNTVGKKCAALNESRRGKTGFQYPRSCTTRNAIGDEAKPWLTKRGKEHEKKWKKREKNKKRIEERGKQRKIEKKTKEKKKTARGHPLAGWSSASCIQTCLEGSCSEYWFVEERRTGPCTC